MDNGESSFFKALGEELSLNITARPFASLRQLPHGIGDRDFKID
jgi:hypothetical protein